MSETILLSRTDSIGDVVLTLPMAGLLKEIKPGCSVVFLGRSYTRAVVEACSFVDAFYDWDTVAGKGILAQSELLKQTKAGVIIHVFPRKEIAVAAMKTGIPVRVGTTGRFYHWWTCNHLVRLSRKRSPLHEAQLNTILLKFLGFNKIIELQDLYPYVDLSKTAPLDERMQQLLQADRHNMIFHPLSMGSAREWGMENFIALAGLLPPEKYNIFVTGTRQEGLEIRGSGIFGLRHVYDLTGRFSLGELLSFIRAADGLVAASTGPLHLAAVMGKMVIGIYPPIRPMHPGRWAPLGPGARVMVIDKECHACRYDKECACMKQITPESVAEVIQKEFATLDNL